MGISFGNECMLPLHLNGNLNNKKEQPVTFGSKFSGSTSGVSAHC